MTQAEAYLKEMNMQIKVKCTTVKMGNILGKSPDTGN